jgi:polyferredoxin
MEGRPSRALRPRTLVYATLLTVLFVGFIVAISLRTPIGLDVMRDRNALYRELPGGVVENSYLLRILNKDSREHTYRLSVTGLPGMSLDTGQPEHRVGAGEVFTLPARVRVPAGTARGGHEIHLKVESLDVPGLSAEEDARFIAPP